MHSRAMTYQLAGLEVLYCDLAIPTVPGSWACYGAGQ